ncbi:AAA family ATPase [Chitinophaga ginsengisoli]|uniref:Putative kinase n=1 Tax=Chitinophaga ginsengisoli TaxID=363837 RepID=A0A2P8FN17_9BACT|nr:AAA family ATPase [Chitinophaga ginsengisoli]PSL23111.1 putative kinase [Chitinophaga ginsengisoli]
MEAIIFCGLQATGKTGFYKEHFLQTHVRISLDLLKSRYREDLFLGACIKGTQPFVVDNTNPGAADREKYIQLAKQHKFKVIGYYFQSILKDALERNSQRTGKAQVPKVGVLNTYKHLEIPQFSEGFDELHYVELGPDGFTIKAWNHEI